MILLEPGSGRPLYLQIYDQVRAAIVSGELKKGSRLPSILGLSETLGMGKNTISLAYSQLAAEGYIRNLERSGFYVQDLANQGVMLTDVSPSLDASEQRSGPVPEYTHDFRYGRVNPGDFPLNLWRKLSNQVLTPPNLGSIVSYPDPLGEPGLRQALAVHLNRDRGVVCRSGQVVICSGTQQSLNLICRLLKDAFPGVAMEEPGYSGARVIFENNGLNIIPVRLDREGIRMKDLEKSGAGLAYLTPARQFPMGGIMPIKRRLELLEWADRTNAVIIEDDYDSEFRYKGRPIPSIQHINPTGRVIYMGSFSKTLAPSLRMSYMVIPLEMMATYKKVFDRYDTFVPWIEQKIVELFIRNRHWERHIRRVRLANKKRHDTLVRALDVTMGSRVKIHGRDAGLHLVLEFDRSGCEPERIRQAQSLGVAVSPMIQYWHWPGYYKNNMVALGFSGLDETRIAGGVELLNRAWFENERI